MIEDWTEYFEYLDALRISGVTNMLGATPYLQKAFELSKEEAAAIHGGWMKTFDRESSAADRALKAMSA